MNLNYILGIHKLYADRKPPPPSLNPGYTLGWWYKVEFWYSGTNWDNYRYLQWTTEWQGAKLVVHVTKPDPSSKVDPGTTTREIVDGELIVVSYDQHLRIIFCYSGYNSPYAGSKFPLLALDSLPVWRQYLVTWHFGNHAQCTLLVSRSVKVLSREVPECIIPTRRIIDCKVKEGNGRLSSRKKKESYKESILVFSSQGPGVT